MSNRIEINLATDTSYLVSSRGTPDDMLTATVLNVPIQSEHFEGEALEDGTQEAIIGELLLGGIYELKGKVSVESKNISLSESEVLEAEQLLQEVSLELDEEAMRSIAEQGVLPMNLFSDIPLSSATQDALSEDTQVGVITSRIYEYEDGTETFEYFLLPDTHVSLEALPRGALSGADLIKHNDLLRPSLEVDENESPRGGINVVKAIFKFLFVASGLRKALRTAEETADEQASRAEPQWAPILIKALEQTDYVQQKIKAIYGIRKYSSQVKRGNPMKAITKLSEIDLSKRTLILVAGTFKRSLEYTPNKRKFEKRWNGSFSELMREMGGERSGFEYILKHTAIEQIISLEHDTVFHNNERNLDYLMKHHGLGRLNFEHPTVVLASSRGGMVAKYMALAGNKQLEGLDGTIGLNIKHIVTVASGLCGYLEDRHRDDIKIGVELFLSIIIFFNPTVRAAVNWIFSTSFDVARNLPGLKMMTSTSPETVVLRDPDNALADVVAYPLANDYTPEKRIFQLTIERAIDRFLGAENDYVIGTISQRNAQPAQLADEFPPLEGGFRHGDGLSDEKTRLALIAFLNRGNLAQHMLKGQTGNKPSSRRAR